MYSGWARWRLRNARRSTWSITAASNPRPRWNRNRLPLGDPSPTRRNRRLRQDATNRFEASTGSYATPSERANTLVDPPGRGASAVIVPASPSAASLRVPSPARTATTSTPSSAAARARRAAWPRRDVSATSSLWSAPRIRWISTRRRAVTADAVRLTMSNTRTRCRVVPAVRCQPVPRSDRLDALTREITHCRACPRLVDWRERVAREKRAAFRGEVYWGRPVPGFGDPAARSGRPQRRRHRAVAV